ncbi:MAG: D-glycero-beta-D-manno-heptose 1,7-bisphosphate 7-phosphatase [Thermodesulfobacteriota bacterium]|nr:D-glycero-beta-D-manno-heptose 1,7-bisphosphate 7-phosphatase [Thermodesulfobacteriota bacterium]
MNREDLQQAVILAGGRGTRLKPLTDTLPKPMIKFHGKPFLEYLIENIREQGIRKVLLLLGYLPEVIQEYFGDGNSFGVQIEYSVTGVENRTGKRMKLAEKKMDSCFLLMYCDNYWPIRIKEMWNHFLETDTEAQISVYTNKDQYTKNNVRINNKGMVICYDSTRSRKDLHGVEIGYAIMKKKILDLIPDENVSFERTVYAALAETYKLSAYETDHKYYSVGSHERLSLTGSFLRRRPAIILDRDGVINEKPPKAEYVRKWDEFKWVPGAKETIRLLRSAGYLIIVITNQAGIGRGIMTESDLSDIHRKMQGELTESGCSIDAIYYCPHDWDDGCDCRKPKPGMLFQAQRDHNVDLTKTYFIGDDSRDEQAGHAAGCKTILVSKERPLLNVVREEIPGVNN